MGLPKRKMAGEGIGMIGSQAPSHDESVDCISAETAATSPHHAEQQQALAVLKKTFQPSSVFSAQKFTDLMAQIEQLVIDNQKYFDPTPHPAGTVLASTASTTLDSYSNSGLVDSGCLTDDTSVSSPNCPQANNAKDSSLSEERGHRAHRQCGKCGVKPLLYCTRKNCGYSTHIFTDWKRHEEGERHWPQERFMCLECPKAQNPTDVSRRPSCEFCNNPFQLGELARAHYIICESARRKNTTFGRKDRLIQHVREEHGLTYTNLQVSTWGYAINSRWPRQCGFCEIQFTDWEQRARHIAEHFEEGKDMSDWKWPPVRPNDFRPPGPHNYPKDDDSDSGNDFDDSNGGLRGRNTVRKRNATSSAARARNPTHRGGSQSFRSDPRERSHQLQGTEHLLQENHLDITNARSRGNLSVALERYLNDPYEPIGVRMNFLRSESSCRLLSGHDLQSIYEDEEDWVNNLRTNMENLQQILRTNEVPHSRSRKLLAWEHTASYGVGALEPMSKALHLLSGFSKLTPIVASGSLDVEPRLREDASKMGEDVYDRHSNPKRQNIPWILQSSVSGTLKIADFGQLQLPSLHARLDKLEPIKTPGIEGNATSDMTPLHLAIQRGNLKRVQVLINRGARMGFQQRLPDTVSQWAVEFRRLSVLEELLRDRINLDISRSIMKIYGNPKPDDWLAGTTFLCDLNLHSSPLTSTELLKDNEFDRRSTVCFYKKQSQDKGSHEKSLEIVATVSKTMRSFLASSSSSCSLHAWEVLNLLQRWLHMSSGNEEFRASGQVARVSGKDPCLRRINYAKVYTVENNGLVDASKWPIDHDSPKFGNKDLRRELLDPESSSQEIRYEDLYQDSRLDIPRHDLEFREYEVKSRAISRSSLRRGAWSQAEDTYLIQLVHTQGALN